VKVLVDTSVWSLALRRRRPERGAAVTAELGRLIAEFEVAIIGPIRQELLSGIREERQYLVLQEKLRAFPDMRLETADYEMAARFCNECRAKGIQGSSTDFLLCAVGVLRGMSIFTTDKDFDAYRRVLGIELHRTPKSAR
jgi:predicted nucleic acid-binding protein